MMKSIIEAILVRLLLLVIYTGAMFTAACLAPLGRFRRRTSMKIRNRGADRHHLMVIGTFYTRNWCISHLSPLARAENVGTITAIVDGPTQPIEKIQYVYPPRWLVRVGGRAVAKFIWAVRHAWRESPDLIMGYHLLPGALTAMVVAKLTGARCGYQVTGGPIQLIGGGAGSENVILSKLGSPSPVLEKLSFALARRFDLIVVRGRTAERFMLDRRLGRHVRVVPGSIETARFSGAECTRDFDLVSVGRLVEVKQPEHILEITARVKARRQRVRTAIVGDGPLLESLKERAIKLGIRDNVEFLGHLDNVEDILQRSKIFLLPSRSEGLSIAMAEAMASGAVPVVADVGDLGDLVRNGEAGWRVSPGDIDQYADRVTELLESPGALQDFSHAARAAAIEHNDVEHVAQRWANTFLDVCGWPEWVLEPWSVPRRRRKLVRLPSRLQTWERISPRGKERLGRLIAKVPPERFLGSRFQATRRLLRRADDWSADTLAAYQLTMLRRMAEWAHERSPYYRQVFDGLGIRPGALSSFEDFRALPLIDKHTLRAHLSEMTAVSPNAPGVDRVSTGGTSGEPLHFHIGSERSGIEYAHLVDAWQRVGYRLEVAQAVLRGKIVQANTDGLHHEYDPLLRRHFYSTFHMGDEQMDRYLRHIAGIGPCFLHVYPSSLDLLARFVERTGAAVPRNILGILAGSEIVYPENRKRAEEVFGVRYYSWYGHSEKLVFAAECERSVDYHVSPTYGYLELLDEDGRPVTTPGQRGEIVGTGFINTVVPFIRYRTGDFATYVGRHCESCGRHHMILRDLRGHRTQEMLVGKNGALILWTALNMHDDTFDRVHRFQFVQNEPGRATLRVVPLDGFAESDRQRILRNLERKLAGNLDLRVELCSEIPLTRMGKTTYVDQRVDLSPFMSGGVQNAS